MNYFKDCLEQSHEYSDASWWLTCYKQAFPDFVAFHDHRQNGDHQQAGIDRSIILSNGKQIWIDEKVRGRNKKTGKVYTDIALEEWSIENSTPGWVVKPLLADYIAYAIAPLGICYLLPVIQLQSAWKKHGEKWKKESFQIRAVNMGYTTISYPIKVDTLFSAIGACLRLQFPPTEEK